MKNRKILNFLLKIIIFVVLFGVVIYPTTVKALDWGLEDIFSQGDDFINKGRSVTDESKLKDITSTIYNTLLVIGVALTVGVGGFLGIQFLMASAEDKAKIKERIIPFILGCIVIYGAFAIWKLAITVLDKIG